MTSLNHLNALRADLNMRPLKSWKESKVKLQMAIDSLASKMPARAPVPATPVPATPADAPAPKRSSTVKQPTVTILPPSSPELLNAEKRRAVIEQVVAQRLKGIDERFPVEPVKRAPVTAPVKRTRTRPALDGIIPLADIARELNIDPKIARARMRRVEIPASYSPAKHVFTTDAKSWVVAQLTKK